jgi:hypothetical protein
MEIGEKLGWKIVTKYYDYLAKSCLFSTFKWSMYIDLLLDLLHWLGWGSCWLAYAKKSNGDEDWKRPTSHPPAFVLEYQSWPFS